jgi:hypothetical protein
VSIGAVRSQSDFERISPSSFRVLSETSRELAYTAGLVVNNLRKQARNIYVRFPMTKCRPIKIRLFGIASHCGEMVQSAQGKR